VSNAFVIGGAGFIGSHLVDRLLADGFGVDVVDDLSAGGLANLAEARSVGGSLKIHHLDAAMRECDSLIGMRTPDVLYHLAAVPRGSVGSSEFARAFSATLALVEAARRHRVPKIVVALPASVLYGHPSNRDLPVKELPLEPRGVRGVIARATVDLLNDARDSDAVEFTALAMSSVYGPRQRPEAGVVASFRSAVERGVAPVIRGDGRQTRDLLFVDDAVDALVRAGERGSGLVINIGTGEQTSIRELWSMISGGRGAMPEHVAASANDVVRFAVSPVRARIHLSWSPWTALADGLTQTR
jgi:UDP-glucose 4-epimerase